MNFSFTGMILTSPRSVEAVKLILTKNPNILDKWKEYPIYCIGTSTENLVKKYLNLSNCYGSHCGNSENLAKFIFNDFKLKKKSLLYPCSEISRDTIENYLLKNGYQIEKIISYKTMPCETLHNDIERIFKLIPEIIVFFSPSIVNNLLLALGERAKILNEIKIIAIGSITEQSLINSGFTVNGVSEKPEPESLLKIVESIRLK